MKLNVAIDAQLRRWDAALGCGSSFLHFMLDDT